MTQPDFAAIRARAQTALPACYDPHRTTIVLSVAEVNALFAAIDELTAENISLDAYVTQVQTIMQAQVDELTAQRDAVLALHEEVDGPDGFCRHDNAAWPCETVRALTKAVQ